MNDLCCVRSTVSVVFNGVLERKFKISRKTFSFQEVVVLLSDGRMIEGSVIHESHPLTTRDEGTTPSPSSYSMWDLAVVVTSSPLTQALPLATSLPPQGDSHSPSYSSNLFLNISIEPSMLKIISFINRLNQ